MTPDELESFADLLAENVADRLACRPRLVDRHGLAEQLGVSVPSIDRLRKAGRIQSINVGNRPMFDTAATIADLREAKQGGIGDE